MDSLRKNISRLPDQNEWARAPIEIRTWDVSRLTTGAEPLPSPVLATLDKREQERAGRYRNYSAFAHFVLSRYLLRSQLSSILGCSDEGVLISYGQFGKPYVEGCSLEFNLSHSEGLIALAISSLPIGIDVEQKRVLADPDLLMDSFFSAQERAWIAPILGDAKSDAILSVWTMKEAILKAWGCGLHFAPRRLTLVPPRTALGTWSVRTINSNANYHISVAGLT